MTFAAKRNELYGMKLRIAGMLRRGEPKDKIAALQAKHDELEKHLNQGEK